MRVLEGALTRPVLRRTDLAAMLLAAIAIILSIRLDLAPTLVDTPLLIGHADQAQTAIVARNIARGNGAVSNSVWLLRGLPDHQPIPYGEDYWSIYVAAYLSIFFRVFDADVRTIVLAASLCKAALAIVCALTLLRISRSAWASLGGLVMLLFSPSMIRSTNGLNDLYLTAGLAAAAILLAFAAERGRAGLFLGSGLAAGIAIGAKPSGLVMLGVYACFVLVRRADRAAIRGLGYAIAGLSVGLIPQLLHNLHYHGVLQVLPVARPRVRMAADVRSITFNHSRGFYSDEPVSFTQEQIASLGFDRALAHVGAWLHALFIDGRIVDACLLVPFGLAVALWLIDWRSFRSASDRVGWNLVAISILMFGAGLAVSALVHVEPRYWNFLLPFVVTTIVLVGARISPVVPVLCAVILVPAGLDQLGERVFRRLPPQYERIAESVPTDAVLYASNPWELAFHTERATVALPYGGWDEFWKLAKRLGVTHVAIVRGQVRNRNLYGPLARGEPTDGIRFVQRGHGLVLGELARSTE